MAVLQAYRALAAVLITVSHLGIVCDRAGSDALRWVHDVGRVGGVDFFFVLSGFLICRTYAAQAGRGHSAPFLLRRLLRIYPLVWIFTLLSLPVYVLATGHGFGDGRELEAGRLLKSLLLWPDELQPILGATWSLRHVVGFYLVFAAFLRWPGVVSGAAAVWACAVVATQMLGGPPQAPAELAFVLSPFNVAFLFGCLLAVALNGRRVPGAAGWLLGGAALFLLGWITHGKLADMQLKLVLYVTGAGLLITGAQALEQRRPRTLPRWLDRLGDASYAMIVLNLPVALAAGKVLGASGLMSGAHVWWAIPLLLGLVVAASLFTHEVIEKPLTRSLSARVDELCRAPVAASASQPRGWRGA